MLAERPTSLGDCVAITLANGLPLPKAGAFAHAGGLVVADRIAAELAFERERLVAWFGS